MSELRAALESGRTAALTQAISGLGGVGKTQLATEYVYRHGASYSVVWWVRSEQPATLRSEYASLAAGLDLPEKEAQDQGLIVEAIKVWLRQNRDWLLIFDNVPDAKSVREYIPTTGTGQVIVTSRDANWRGVAESLTVRVLPESEAVEFLLNRTGQDNKTAATALANELGCLPLALEQAAAYIEASGRTISHYLDLFRERKKEILQRGEPSTDYPDTVATTWEVSFEQVESKNAAAADLLKLCAFFASDDIPLAIIKDGAKYLPERLSAAAANPIAFDDCLIALRRYSLIEVDGEFISVHRLVQVVTQHRMPEEAVKEWAESAIRILVEFFPDDSFDVRVWSICLLLLPHALAALSDTETLEFDASVTAGLLNKIGMYLYGLAELIQSQSMFRRALAIGEAAFGDGHPQVATFANNLGLVLQDLGDLDGAKAKFKRALTIDEATLGLDHPNVAIRVNNLGLVLKEQGDLVGAKANYERALAIGEAAFGDSHPQVATFANNLGLVLKDLGDLDGAKAKFKRALTIDEAAFGPNHPKVAIRVNNLGLVLKAQGNLVGAKANFERALNIDEASFGDSHPSVARDVNNLGLVLKEQDDLDGAKANFERALDIDEAAFGSDHPGVAIDVNNLGSVLKALGDLAGARANYERALKIFQEFLGEDHPNTKTVSDNLKALKNS